MLYQEYFHQLHFYQPGSKTDNITLALFIKFLKENFQFEDEHFMTPEELDPINDIYKLFIEN